MSVLTAIAAGVLLGSGAQPRELGRVSWQRDFERGAAESRASGRPMLLLFDEVPGCSTVIAFGDEVLSHPLIAEAAETLFVPVAVYNNVGGKDREVLKRFAEPAWNNPVVRFLADGERELAPRYAGEYTVRAFAERMGTALRAAGRETPGWLSMLADEPRAAGDDKKQLEGSAVRHVPMTAAQKARINAGAEPSAVLSPRQQAILRAAQAEPRKGWPDVLAEEDVRSAFGRVARERAAP